LCQMHVNFLPESIDDSILVGHVARIKCVSNICDLFGRKHR
jgi:hypothetical protein